MPFDREMLPVTVTALIAISFVIGLAVGYGIGINDNILAFSLVAIGVAVVYGAVAVGVLIGKGTRDGSPTASSISSLVYRDGELVAIVRDGTE